uniref:Perlucin-like protein n=1 Tax=Crassostrea virginica TaxID=6565 RepID=A0A8B8CA72_CRAVI|nr:perlucin-like protein [Crassostrea virginica]
MYYHRPNGCDVGWSRFESHCYLYNETTVSWQDAKMFCESQGAYLLEVESQQEMDWVTEKLLKTDVCSDPRFCSTWSGGTKSGFLWQHSNSNLTYTNWEPSEPNGDGKCINIRHHGGWNDAICTKSFKFICEKALY